MRKLCLMLSAIFLLLLNTMAQTRTVTGKVTDEKGAPIPNVSVLVRGTTNGTTTATDGSYSITLPANAKELQFTSLSYDPVTVTIGNKTSISVSMAAAGTKELGEVVVTGISRVKKSEYTGATTKIGEGQIKNVPVGSFDQILQGKVPGISVLSSSGAPGTSATIIIRGTGSIQGSNDPLYVVDGIPVEAGVFQGLNPNDFASIDVIRDAAGAALYGSRGSAGVIVITTKKGTAGKMKFGYSAQMGVKSRPEFSFRPMNTTELLKAQFDYGRVSGSNDNNANIPGWYYSTQNPRYATLSPADQASAQQALDSLSKINTNWGDEIFRQANFSNHQISLSGGSGKTRLYSSLGLYNEEGTTLRTDMKRISFRNNIDYVDDKFSYSVNSNIGYTKRNFQQSTVTNSLANPFLTSAVNVPYARLRKDDGTFATGVAPSNSAANQLELTELDENYNTQVKATLGLNFNYKINKYFGLGLVTGVDFRETQGTNYGNRLAFSRSNPNVTNPTTRAGFQRETFSRFLTADVRPSIYFRKSVSDKHDIDIAVYGEYVKEAAKDFNFTGYGSDPKRPNTPATIIQGNAANQLFANVGGRKAETSLLSGLITAKYTYKGKYTLSGSFRDDGSSKLPENNRWQTFYSVGAVWEASKEDFIKNISAINVLRIKLSYGGSGNANNFPASDGTFFTGAYPYQPQYSGGTYSGLETIIATYPGNNDMKWESTFVTNLGIDFELLNRRLYGDINLYNKTTKDLFVQNALSGVGGFGDFPIDVNAGELSNKGFEWNINAEVIRKQDFVWTLFANGGYNKNKVISLGGVNSFELGTEKVTEGLPLGSHIEVGWAGVDAATGQPLYYTKEGLITNVYSSDDAVQTWGTSEAPWRGGFGTSVRFKGFDLSVLFSWQRGATKVDNLEYFMENPVGFLGNGYNQSSDLVFWQKPGDIVNTPSPLYGTNFSSKIIHDASFMRLREVSLSYTIPKSMLQNVKYLSNARLYVQGNNLFMWTKWRGRDPEGGAANINLSEYPNPRGVTAGLEITF